MIKDPLLQNPCSHDPVRVTHHSCRVQLLQYILQHDTRAAHMASMPWRRREATSRVDSHPNYAGRTCIATGRSTSVIIRHFTNGSEQRSTPFRFQYNSRSFQIGRTQWFALAKETIWSVAWDRQFNTVTSTLTEIRSSLTDVVLITLV